MARCAALADLSVSLWGTPTEDSVKAQVPGTWVAECAADAVRDADLVVTMLPDGNAVAQVAEGEAGFLAAMRRDAIWIQSATIGIAVTDELVALTRNRRVSFVDAPVLGSLGPAQRGELVILASGDAAVLDRCAPYFAAVGSRTLHFGEAGAGSRAKIVINNWMMSCIAALAETIALAEGLGIDGQTILSAIHGTGVDMEYAQTKGGMMCRGEFPVEMSLSYALKDALLARAAADACGLPARLTDAAIEILGRAAFDHGHEDMAAALYGAVSASADPHRTSSEEPK